MKTRFATWHTLGESKWTGQVLERVTVMRDREKGTFDWFHLVASDKGNLHDASVAVRACICMTASKGHGEVGC